ncbi:MAG: DUF3991 and TOPRIM domain-containing protein [Clostridia bacterium]
MPYIPPEIVEKAKEMDVLTYLQNYEPNELVKVGNGTYSTKTHDSIRISNGLWNWFSRGVGGKNAVSYLMKVKNYSFLDAIQTIIGNVSVKQPVIYREEKKEKTEFVLPLKSINSERAKRYLVKRGIDLEIINECINSGLIYESEPNHNVVFLGTDEEKKYKYAFFRGTNDTRFMGESKGSDKAYTFRLLSNNESERVHLFESAIDLLSYATLLKMKNIDWKNENMISLGGVNKPSEEQEVNDKIPIAIIKFLENNSNIKQIYLHFDNDEIGEKASKALMEKLSNKYEVIDNRPPVGKDCNDYLKYVLDFQNINRQANNKRIYEKVR